MRLLPNKSGARRQNLHVDAVDVEEVDARFHVTLGHARAGAIESFRQFGAGALMNWCSDAVARMLKS